MKKHNLIYPLILLGGALLLHAFSDRKESPQEAFVYRCSDESEIVFSLVEKEDPSAAILKWRGKKLKVFVTPAASGAKYMAASGQSFWIKGSQAIALWSGEEPEINCATVRIINK
jgi:membrane-bound inhibitor of C-type lysozyme